MKKRLATKGLKILFNYLAEYKKDLVVLSVMGIILAVANALAPYLVGRLFDSILNPGGIFTNTAFKMPLWLFFIVLWGLVRLTADVIDWRTNLKGGVIAEELYSGYLIKGFGRALELPLSFHKKHKMGQTGDRLTRGAKALHGISGNVIFRLAPQLLSVFVAFFITFHINTLLSVIMLLGVSVYVAILVKISPPLASSAKKMHKAYSRAYGDACDSLSNIKEVKQGVSEKYEQRKIFKRFRLQASELLFKIAEKWQRLSFYQRLIFALTQLAIFIVSVLFIQKGKMTIGELVMFNGYVAMLFGPFIILGYNWQVIQNGLAAIENSEEVLNALSEKYAPENMVIPGDIKGGVEFRDVSFYYEKKQGNILDGVSFKVEPGEVVALVGESGVGKSTLVDLISGYYFPQKGKVLIDGHNVKSLNLRFLRSKIAVVQQEVVLFNDTIKTNIKYGNFGASDEEVEEAARKAHCLEFIEKFSKKWKQVVGERGVKLSVGQKQRVAIARAILRDPRILILDEPTSALDANSEKVIQKSLEKLMESRTTFIVAHRLSTVRKADKIFVFKDGKIVERGKHEELLDIPDGIYRNFYELQIGLK